MFKIAGQFFFAPLVAASLFISALVGFGNWLHAQQAPPAPSAATSIAQPVSVVGPVGTTQLSYPTGATPIETNASGTTGAVVATLPGTAGKTTYLCGFNATALATAGTVTNLTITGLTTGFNFLQPVGTSPLVGVTTETFYPCVQASAVNTAIVVNGGLAGTGGLQQVNVWGYQSAN
jgi:hypothetical protein